MNIEMLYGKIHRATVTQADLNYVGSITIDEDLMDACGLKEYQKVQIVDIDNGNRFETYVISEKRKVESFASTVRRQGKIGRAHD